MIPSGSDPYRASFVNTDANVASSRCALGGEITRGNAALDLTWASPLSVSQSRPTVAGKCVWSQRSPVNSKHRGRRVKSRVRRC